MSFVRKLRNYWLLFSCLPLGGLLVGLMIFTVYAIFFVGTDLALYGIGFMLVLLFLTQWTGRWLSYLSHGNRALQQGDPAEAIKQYEKGLGLKRWRSDDPRRAMLLLGLANAYVDDGAYREAEPIVEDCLAAHRAAWGANHSLAQAALMAKGNLALYEADFDEAERIYRLILENKRATYGPEHPDVGVCLNNLGKLACDRHDYAGGERFYREALDIFRKKLKPAHPLIGMGLNNIAYVLARQGRIDEAEPLSEEARGIAQKALPAEHYVQAVFWNTRSLIHFRKGQLVEARELLLEGIRLLEGHYGDFHPQLIPHLTLLAEIHLADKRYSDAESLCRRAMEIADERLKPEHPDRMEALELYARILPVMGRNEEAAALEEKIAVIKAKAGTERDASSEEGRSNENRLD